jgi:hypothetical protein
MTQASGASAQPHLYIRDIKRMPIPIPPLAEQKRIVAKVEELVRWCDQLETHLATAETTGAHLLDAAFGGILNGRRNGEPPHLPKQTPTATHANGLRPH